MSQSEFWNNHTLDPYNFNLAGFNQALSIGLDLHSSAYDEELASNIELCLSSCSSPQFSFTDTELSLSSDAQVENDIVNDTFENDQLFTSELVGGANLPVQRARVRVPIGRPSNVKLCSSCRSFLEIESRFLTNRKTCTKCLIKRRVRQRLKRNKHKAEKNLP
jgi:hypothetical protein